MMRLRKTEAAILNSSSSLSSSAVNPSNRQSDKRQISVGKGKDGDDTIVDVVNPMRNTIATSTDIPKEKSVPKFVFSISRYSKDI